MAGARRGTPWRPQWCRDALLAREAMVESPCWGLVPRMGRYRREGAMMSGYMKEYHIGDYGVQLWVDVDPGASFNERRSAEGMALAIACDAALEPYGLVVELGEDMSALRRRLADAPRM